MSNKNWDPNLTPEQNYILKQEGTEPPGSSILNNEKREGSYHCVGCGTKLFESNTKYESGSGWPSFFESIPNVFEEKKDMHIGYERTEYHCKRCGGHHGHIFEDGPKPTGKRYCNNGACLVFKPKSWKVIHAPYKCFEYNQVKQYNLFAMSTRPRRHKFVKLSFHPPW